MFDLLRIVRDTSRATPRDRDKNAIEPARRGFTLKRLDAGRRVSHNACLKYQITPAFVVGANYVYTKNSGADATGGAHYNQASIGADYFLSKRTDVYFVGTYQRASGTDSTGRSAVASINQLTPSTSNHQVALRIAMRHKF